MSGSLRVDRPQIPAGMVAIPVRTRLVQPGEDLVALIQASVAGIAQPGDVLAVSETAVAIAQRQAVPAEYVRPSRLALLLSRHAGAMATVSQPDSFPFFLSFFLSPLFSSSSSLPLFLLLSFLLGFFFSFFCFAFSAFFLFTLSIPPFVFLLFFSPFPFLPLLPKIRRYQ